MWAVVRDAVLAYPVVVSNISEESRELLTPTIPVYLSQTVTGLQRRQSELTLGILSPLDRTGGGKTGFHLPRHQRGHDLRGNETKRGTNAARGMKGR